MMKTNKRIFIINGSGGVGKDTFVALFAKHYGEEKVWNYSSVTKVKRIAKEIGWTGAKTEKDRKFLSDLKLLTTEYNDMPMEDLKAKVKEFNRSLKAEILFLHIREPEEIEKAVKEFSAETILIRRDWIPQITSNMADANVYNYNYDITIHNDGSLEDYENITKQFVKDVKKNFYFINAIYDLNNINENKN